MLTNRPRLVLGLALFLGSLAVYRMASTPAVVNRLDNQWYFPTAVSLLTEGDAELSEFMAVEGFRRSYRLSRYGGRVYNYFPVGTSLVILPVVAAESLRQPDPTEPARTLKGSDLAADVLAAGSVGLLFLVGLSLGGSTRVVFLATLIFAFATPHFAIHAGGLWSHNTSSFLFLVSTWLLVRDDEKRLSWLSSFPAALGYLSRPTSVLWILVSAVYLGRDWKQWLRHVLVLLAIGALFVAWSLSTFGSILPRYYQQRRFSFDQFPEAMAGHLVSPNRGLFVFAPILLLSLVGIYLVVRRRSSYHAFFPSLATYCVVEWLVVSTYTKWWGGGSFGPRLLAEALPAWSLLLIPALEALARVRTARRRVAVGCLAVLLGWSGFVEYRGATDAAVYGWNRWPRRVSRATERIWDWSDLQILRRKRRQLTSATRLFAIRGESGARGSLDEPGILRRFHLTTVERKGSWRATSSMP